MIAEGKDIDEGYLTLHDLIVELDIEINNDKLITPTNVATCLAITIDIGNNALFIEHSKLNKIMKMVNEVLELNFIYSQITVVNSFQVECGPSEELYQQNFTPTEKQSSQEHIKLNADFDVPVQKLSLLL